jgi:hypothetical protein
MRATAAANSQIPSHWLDHRGTDTMIAANTPMMPMTIPAIPGTSIELEESIDALM